MHEATMHTMSMQPLLLDDYYGYTGTPWDYDCHGAYDYNHVCDDDY